MLSIICVLVCVFVNLSLSSVGAGSHNSSTNALNTEDSVGELNSKPNDLKVKLKNTLSIIENNNNGSISKPSILKNYTETNYTAKIGENNIYSFENNGKKRNETLKVFVRDQKVSFHNQTLSKVNHDSNKSENLRDFKTLSTNYNNNIIPKDDGESYSNIYKPANTSSKNNVQLEKNLNSKVAPQELSIAKNNIEINMQKEKNSTVLLKPNNFLTNSTISGKPSSNKMRNVGQIPHFLSFNSTVENLEKNINFSQFPSQHRNFNQHKHDFSKEDILHYPLKYPKTSTENETELKLLLSLLRCAPNGSLVLYQGEELGWVAFNETIESTYQLPHCSVCPTCSGEECQACVPRRLGTECKPCNPETPWPAEKQQVSPKFRFLFKPRCIFGLLGKVFGLINRKKCHFRCRSPPPSPPPRPPWYPPPLPRQRPPWRPPPPPPPPPPRRPPPPPPPPPTTTTTTTTTPAPTPAPSRRPPRPKPTPDHRRGGRRWPGGRRGRRRCYPCESEEDCDDSCRPHRYPCRDGSCSDESRSSIYIPNPRRKSKKCNSCEPGEHESDEINIVINYN